MSDLRVLIVGAGIGGLSSAIALRQRGFDPVVVERSSGPLNEGASITIPANGARALALLGVLDDAAVRSVVVSCMNYVYQDEVVLSVPLNQGFGGWPWLALLRRDLLGSLAQRVAGVRFGLGVTKLFEDDNWVDVELTDGTKDRFDVVVGADGTHSTVRSLMAGQREADAEWAGLLYWRAVIDDATRPPVMKVFIGDGSMFGLFPGGPGLTYGWAARSAPTRESDAIAGRRQRLFDQFSELGSEPRAFLERTRTDDEFSCTPPEWVRALTWHSKRVVLLGDAVHSSPPFMAQGACLAMEDAIVLADCLSAKALPEAFAHYEARRRPRAELVQRVVTMATASIAIGSAASSTMEMFRLAGPSAVLAPFGLLMESL